MVFSQSFDEFDNNQFCQGLSSRKRGAGLTVSIGRKLHGHSRTYSSEQFYRPYPRPVWLCIRDERIDLLTYRSKIKRIDSLLGLFALVVASQFYEYAYVSFEIGLCAIEIERSDR